MKVVICTSRTFVVVKFFYITVTAISILLLNSLVFQDDKRNNLFGVRDRTS